MDHHLHEAAFIDQFANGVVILIFIVMLSLQFCIEGCADHVGGLKYWFHRILALMVLLQAVKNIDPYRVLGILPSVALTFTSDNITALIVTAGAYFVVRTVSVLYTHKFRDPPRYMIRNAVAFCVLTFIFANAVNVVALIKNRRWFSGLYYIWVMISLVAIGGSGELAILRLLQSLHSLNIRSPFSTCLPHLRSKPKAPPLSPQPKATTRKKPSKMESWHTQPSARTFPPRALSHDNNSVKGGAGAGAGAGATTGTVPNDNPSTPFFSPPPPLAQFEGHTFLLHPNFANARRVDSLAEGETGAPAATGLIPGGHHSSLPPRAPQLLTSSSLDDVLKKAAPNSTARRLLDSTKHSHSLPDHRNSSSSLLDTPSRSTMFSSSENADRSREGRLATDTGTADRHRQSTNVDTQRRRSSTMVSDSALASAAARLDRTPTGPSGAGPGGTFQPWKYGSDFSAFSEPTRSDSYFLPPPHQKLPPDESTSTNSPLPRTAQSSEVVLRLQRLFFILLIGIVGVMGFLAYATHLRFSNFERPHTHTPGFQVSSCVFGWIQWCFMSVYQWLAWIPLCRGESRSRWANSGAHSGARPS